MPRQITGISSLCDAEAALKAQGVAFDTVYQDKLPPCYRFGVRSEQLSVHIYFNQGRENIAYFTPALNSLQVFDTPRQDHMLGEKHFYHRPAPAQVSL